TDDRDVTPRVTADSALLLFSDVAADRAEADLVLHLGQGGDQTSYVERIGCEQVERDALRALRTDAGQPPELVDEVLDRAFVHASEARQTAEPAGQRTHLLLRHI